MVYQNFQTEKPEQSRESSRQIDWLFGERDHKFACWEEKMKRRRTDIEIGRTQCVCSVEEGFPGGTSVQPDFEQLSFSV